MNIELANGSEGYIPPPEQHALGGYTTWPARTAGLEVEAEPKIVATMLGLLEQVSGKVRRKVAPRPAPYAEHILASRPIAYWRLEEMAGPNRPRCQRPWPRCSVTKGRRVLPAGAGSARVFQPAFHQPAPPSRRRAPQRRARVASRESYSVELWFWNGLPGNARAVTGSLLETPNGDAIQLSGSSVPSPNCLALVHGALIVSGKTEVPAKTWHHVVLNPARSRRGRLS